MNTMLIGALILVLLVLVVASKLTKLVKFVVFLLGICALIFLWRSGQVDSFATFLRNILPKNFLYF